MFTSLSFLLKRLSTSTLFVLLLLSGCGSSATTTNLSTPPPVLSTSTSTSPLLGPLAKSIAFDLDGWIHVQSASGFTCGAMLPADPPGFLVLPTAQPTYDQGTLQSAQNYVTALYENQGDTDKLTNHRDTVPYPAFSVNSSAFQLVAVSNVTRNCNEILHITNIRNMPIHIMPALVTFTTDTQRNNQYYHLIEGCSLLSLVPGCGGQFGGQENEYEATFWLHPGKTNTIIPATITGGGTLTLQPGEIAKVILSYVTEPSGNFSYSLIPSFTLGLPGKQPTTYAVPQLQETFAFALGSQTSCYGLQGQQFVKLSAAQMAEAWCM